MPPQKEGEIAMASVEKFSAGAVRNQLRHNRREIEHSSNPDIDPSRQGQDYVLSPDRGMTEYDYFKQRILPNRKTPQPTHILVLLPGPVSRTPQAASKVQMTRSNYLQSTAKLKMHLEKSQLMKNLSVRPHWSRTAFIFSSRTKNSKSMATCCALLRRSRWNTFHPDRRNTSR